MILILNHRDSFVFNLARYIEELGHPTQMQDAANVSTAEIERTQPRAIVLSPGPCTPNEASTSVDIVKAYSGQIPILGVCLGHQIIGQAFGAEIAPATTPLYGQSRPIHHCGTDLFHGLTNPLRMGLYHSLIVALHDEKTLRIQARSPSHEVMAMRHVSHPTFGVQFHPESILSEQGHTLLANFLSHVRPAA